MMIKTISVNDAKEWLASGEAILIDVREAEEFKAEHIPYAMSVPLTQIENIFQKLTLPQNMKIVFHCLHGSRGQSACDFAISKLENDVFNIDGGITSWKANGLPLVSTKDQNSPRFSIFQQVQMIVGSLILFCILLGLMGFGLAIVIAGAIAGMLAFAGFTGWCGLAMLLQKMPWNKNKNGNPT